MAALYAVVLTTAFAASRVRPLAMDSLAADYNIGARNLVAVFSLAASIAVLAVLRGVGLQRLLGIIKSRRGSRAFDHRRHPRRRRDHR
jgi:hypothetical protein